MSTGAWIVVAAVVLALVVGLWRAATDGRFRGTHVVRGDAGAAGAGSTRRGRPATHPPAPSSSRPSASTLGERATLLQFSSAFCAPCRATRRVLDEVTGLVEGVRPRRGRRRAPPRRHPRLRHPAHAHDGGARRVGRRGHPGDRCAARGPGAERAGAGVISRYGCMGHMVRRRRSARPGSAYCRGHVLDHAHQAPRSGPLPRALGAVSNVLTGPAADLSVSRLPTGTA